MNAWARQDASQAVMVVPTFSPITNAAAVSNGITPICARPIVIPNVADDDCTTNVKTHPTDAHNKTPE